MNQYHRLEVLTRERGEIVFIYLIGDLNAATSESFLRSIPNRFSNKNIVLSCGKLRSLDGTGMMAISILMTHCQRENKKFSLRGVDGQPKEIINYFKVNHLISNKKFRKPWFNNIFKLSDRVNRYG